MHDNEAPSIQLLGKVLAAAKKYDCPLATSLIIINLHGVLSMDSLSVYAVACVDGMSGPAAHAAKQWRKSNFPSLPATGEPDATSSHMPW